MTLNESGRNGMSNKGNIIEGGPNGSSIISPFVISNKQ